MTASVRGKLVYANKSVVGGCLLPLFLEIKQQPPVFFRFRRPFLFAWDSHRLTDMMVIDCFLERRPKTYNPTWKEHITPHILASHLNFRPYNHYSVEDIHQACPRAALQLAYHQLKTRLARFRLAMLTTQTVPSLIIESLRLFRPILPVHRKICKTLLYSKVFSGERHSHARTAQGAKKKK